MAVRLKDIARDLGVSVVTVSKVLRGNKDIGDETRRRVLKRMKELNYQPNMLARGLASGKTYTVGLVVPDLVDPFFATFAKSLSSLLREHNRALIMTSSDEDPEVERQEIRTLLRRGIDVLLIASCQPSLRNFYELGDDRTPYLLFDRNFAHLNANFIGSDDVLIGEMATRHLIETGRTRIAHIARQGTSPAFDRLRGYRNALLDARLPAPEEYVFTGKRFEESDDRIAADAVKHLLALPQPPDAIFCYNDLTAIGAIEAVLARGLRVPQDIAIIGCGNMPYNDYLRVPLSSIDHNVVELGRRAGELALDLANAGEQGQEKEELSPVRSVLVPPTLVARASTGAAG